MTDENESEIDPGFWERDYWMSPAEAAPVLDVTPPVVRSWITSGQLQAFDVSRKGQKPRWKISRAAIIEFQKSRCNIR